jgi:hypothetical protein
MNMGPSYSHDQWSHGTPSQEYDKQGHDVNLEEEDEGFIEPPTGRAGNYSGDEDMFVCTTWMNMGMDVITGTAQQRDTYWDRMKEYFGTNNTSGIEQTDRSVWSRWAAILAECQKWSAMLAQVKRINPSGTNDKYRVI